MLIQLQSKRIVKGQDMADRFGISLRTVYRDIKTLEEAGVPIAGEPGSGYSLMEGYRLPPVMFTREEATAFLTAEKLVEKFTDSATYEVYQSALYKIKAVLRSDEKYHLESMNDSIEVVGNPYQPRDNKTSNHIQVILNSIAQKKVLVLDYFANHSQEQTNRKIEPVGIYLRLSHWYVIGYCWLRCDYRSFRIDRIAAIKYTDTAFQKEHPPLKAYLADITQEKSDLHTVVMLVDKDAVRWLGEQKYYNGYVSEREMDEQIEMTFLTASLEGFARWYMMLGDSAEIVSPTILKLRVATIAKEILEKVAR